MPKCLSPTRESPGRAATGSMSGLKLFLPQHYSVVSQGRAVSLDILWLLSVLYKPAGTVPFVSRVLMIAFRGGPLRQDRWSSRCSGLAPIGTTRSRRGIDGGHPRYGSTRKRHGACGTTLRSTSVRFLSISIYKETADYTATRSRKDFFDC